MRHTELCPELRSTAALYAAGELDDAAYTKHLEHCEVCRAEVEALQALFAEPEAHAPEIDAPSGLRARVLRDAAGARPWTRWQKQAEAPGIYFALAAEAQWEDTAYEGVQTRRLFVDAEADRVTMMVRMAPGSAYPPHRHGGPEECLVISGDIDVGGTRMEAGDYQRMAGDEVHDWQRSEGGCTLLIVCSQHDQML